MICIHPEPRHKPKAGQVTQVRVQVKSRYQTDCDRGFPVKKATLDAFDFLVIAFLNIGNFFRGKDGSSGWREPEFFTFPASFIREHHLDTSTWEKVRLRGLEKEIEPFKNDPGFELIAAALGVPKPMRAAKTPTS